jgi:hypothetical protein
MFFSADGNLINKDMNTVEHMSNDGGNQKNSSWESCIGAQTKDQMIRGLFGSAIQHTLYNDDGSLRIGNFSLKPSGNTLIIKSDNGKEFYINSDPTHSSVGTTNNTKSNINWFGYF